jgi:hypothetical protein
VGQDLVPILAKFHSEVLLPDIKRVVEESEHRLRDEMHTLFDALAKRLDRLETEYQSGREPSRCDRGGAAEDGDQGGGPGPEGAGGSP